MQRVEGVDVFSASDLIDAVACERLGELGRLHAEGLGPPRPEPDASAQLISRKGDEHERRYLDALVATYGEGVVQLPARAESTLADLAAAEAATLDALEAGAPYVYQAAFYHDGFRGRADFLRRIERPSARRPWSYEVIDTKLALTPRPYYVIQLCNYSEHLARLQGTAPEEAEVVLGSGQPARFRLRDYAAYYRRVKAAFLERFAARAPAYPHACTHCEICRWYPVCERQRDADDYLGIVANIRSDQRERLEAAGIRTVAELAVAPPEARPAKMRAETFAQLRAQAALQHRQRRAFAAAVPGAQTYLYEFRDDVDARKGFELLPPPDPGDVYFDMEGDPLYAPGRGLEYLFGVYVQAEGRYAAFWAKTPAEERAALEAFLDLVAAQLALHPHAHVYHYAPYETTALKRLTSRFGSREDQLADLLRTGTFVDLYAVVRQAIRISQPSYSIKKLEPFYGFARTTDLRRGDDSIVMFESWLVTGDDVTLEEIERYNDDDCRSTRLLHEWLLALRKERAAQTGRLLPFRSDPEPPAGDGAVAESGIGPELLDGLDEPESEVALRAQPERLRGAWLLGHLVAYHRREANPTWWKYFHRIENTDELVEFDGEALGGLELCADVAPYKLAPADRNLVYTFAYPDQQHNLGLGEVTYPHSGKTAGTIVAYDEAHNRVAVKVSKSVVAADLRALIPGGPIRTDAQQAALRRIAEAFRDGVLEREYPAVADLLFRRAPRLRDRPRGARVQPERVTPQAVAELIAALDGSYLFIQGPPGSGKTTVGGFAIAELLAAGKKVGVVSRSHAAVHHLLQKVERELESRGVRVHGLYKTGTGDGSVYDSPLAARMIENTAKNADFAAPHALAGGTPWLFAREELIGAYDVLVIDEAGQLSLGDALACAGAARNVVLLGDPLQLAQVEQGSHPVGTGASILEHLLGAAPTVPEERGVFLDVSYRMQPDTCAFISTHVYEGRLGSAPSANGNRIDAAGLKPAGLLFLGVEHNGNSRASEEEADAVVALTRAIVGGSVTVEGRPERPATEHDLLVVAPYNAQRRLIRSRLAAAGFADVRVGTVDKFQGQEAPVVIYSMATSSGADVPRDLGFLFEQNRFNVALSRAQALSVLVCSPRLLDVDCATPEQMRLANLLCAFVEAAG